MFFTVKETLSEGVQVCYSQDQKLFLFITGHEFYNTSGNLWENDNCDYYLRKGVKEYLTKNFDSFNEETKREFTDYMRLIVKA